VKLPADPPRNVIDDDAREQTILAPYIICRRPVIRQYWTTAAPLSVRKPVINEGMMRRLGH